MKKSGRIMARDSEEVEAITATYFATQLHKVLTARPFRISTENLPLARIKRIMKQDSCHPHPRMISADAVPFMAFAVQLFVGYVTQLAWQQSSSKSTLQLKDIKAAVASSARFDFLIDVIDEYDAQMMRESGSKQANQDLELKLGGRRVASSDQSLLPHEYLPRQLDQGVIGAGPAPGHLPAAPACSTQPFSDPMIPYIEDELIDAVDLLQDY